MAKDIEVIQLGMTIIKVTSLTPMGPDKLVMWEGNINTIDYDTNSAINDSELTILNALTYQYQNSNYIYSFGKAEPIRIPCPNITSVNAECFCTGECQEEAPEEFSIDDNFFLQIKQIK